MSKLISEEIRDKVKALHFDRYLLSLLPISVGVLTVDAFLMSILDPSLLTDSPPEEVDAFLNILLLKYEFVYLSQKLTSIDPVVY
jgi:hypothetical protein